MEHEHEITNMERGSTNMQSTVNPGQGRRRWARIVGTGTTALVAAAALSSTAGAATTTPRPNGGFGGASGSVAALNASSSSMEVQNTNSGQTTVSWTSTTKFSKTVSQAISALAGECVTVTGTQSKKSKTTIAARSITVSSATSSGSCAGFLTRHGSGADGAAAGGTPGGFQFRGGDGRPGFGGSNAEGGGSFSRGGTGNGPPNFGKALASIAIASGKVKSVKGSTLTVSGFSLSPGQFTRGTPTSGSKAKTPTPPKTQTLTITTSKSTTVSATQSAAATDLAVGDCVSAFGPAASNGAITATTVRITSTGGASCSAGFGRFGGGPGGGFFGGAGNNGSSGGGGGA